MAEPDGRVGHRHEHEVALVQRRHELRADAGNQRGGAGHDEDGHPKRRDAVPQREVEHGPVEPHQRAHHRVVLLAPHPTADQQAAEHRHQRHRQDRRADHRERLRVGQWVEELALLSGEREHGQEGQDDDRQREEDRPPDQARRLEHGLRHAAPIASVHPPLLDEPERVLRHHDPGVHQNADRDRDPRQRHDVGAHPEVAHEEEGGEDGERQRDGHDQHRAKIQQKDDVDDGDDDRLFDQRPLERRDGPLDERGSVVERHNPDPRRQAGLQRDDFLLHAVDHIDRADAVPGHDHAADRLVRSLDQRRRSEGVSNLHLGHLLDEDRHPALGANDDVLDVTDVLDQTEAADHRPGAARLHDVAADVPVAAQDRIDDGRERDLVGAQAGGIDVDLVLPHRAPDAGDFGDAGHRVELVPDEPILERSQVSQRVALALDGVPEHVTDAGRVRSERWDDAGRQCLGQQVQPLQHPRASEIEIDRVLEDDVDHRKPEGR